MKSIHRLLPLILAATFAFAGCAKQQIVRNEDSLPQTAPQTQTAVTPPSVAPKEVKEQPVEPQKVEIAVVEETVATEQRAAAETQASAAELAKALQTVYFNLDSSTLDNTARETLSKNLEVLKKNPKLKVRIEGHCDERGSDEYNLALGESRARAAARYLTALGVAPDRLAVISYGKEKPVAQGHDEKAWSKNRRGEFVAQ